MGITSFNHPYNNGYCIIIEYELLSIFIALVRHARLEAEENVLPGQYPLHKHNRAPHVGGVLQCHVGVALHCHVIRQGWNN